MASSKVEKMIKKIGDDLEKLKVAAQLSSVPKVSKTKERPVSIDACSKKSELMLFTVAELKSWLISKKVDKLSGLKKEELVKRVKKHIKKSAPVVPEYSTSESTGSSSSLDDISVDPLMPPVQLSEQEFMSMVMMYLQSKQ